MGIKNICTWLYNKNLLKQIYDFSGLRIDTLFIDGSELLMDYAEKNGKEDMIPYFLYKLSEIIHIIQPTDEIFFSLDGSSPAAKFQNERRITFYQKRMLIDDFIYPTEEGFKRKLEHIQKDEKGISQILLDFIPQLINDKEIKAKTILYSSRYAPGESEHKYFQYFRDKKQSNQLKPNQNHFIFSNDNDLIFLTLQFIDENFYVVKYDKETPDTFYIVDISALRNSLLNEIKKNVGKQFDDKRVIDDVIALSFILGNDFIPHFPDVVNDSQTFDQLLNSYCQMNQQSKKTKYHYLINNDSFNVSILKRIVSIYFQNLDQNNSDNYHFVNLNNHHSQMSLPDKMMFHFYDKENRISSFNNNFSRFQNINLYNHRSQNNLPQNNDFLFGNQDSEISSLNCDYEHPNDHSQNDEFHYVPEKYDDNDNDNHQNRKVKNDNFHYSYVNNDKQDRIGSFNDNLYHYSRGNTQDRIKSFNNEFHYSINIHNDTQKNDDFHYSNNKQNDTKKDIYDYSSHDNNYHYYTEKEKITYKRNMAQSVLRIFNFTWLYYVHGVPSWTYYYPYLYCPPLQNAVNMMTQEGKKFFTKLNDKEITDPLLKSLIIYPATKTTNIPWEIYKLKIPPSPLAEKYFPLSPKAPMFDLEEIKKSYKNALKNLSEEEQVYNRRDEPFFIYSKN